MACSYFYTLNEPRAIRYGRNQVNGWKLSVNYRSYPDRNSQVLRADLNDHIFRMPDLPAMFDSEEAALAMRTKFREHVEDLVRGKGPR